MWINKQRLIKQDLIKQLTTSCQRRRGKAGQNAIGCLASAASVDHRLMKGLNNKRLSELEGHTAGPRLHSSGALLRTRKNEKRKILRISDRQKVGQQTASCSFVMAAAAARGGPPPRPSTKPHFLSEISDGGTIKRLW